MADCLDCDTVGDGCCDSLTVPVGDTGATGAQGEQGEQGLPGTVAITFANNAARDAATPTSIGELGLQIDTGIIWEGTALVAGSWSNTNILKVSRTVFVDSVNGHDSGTTIGLPQRFDRPFATKAAAISSALTLTPTATNRVLINVAMANSSEAIAFPSSCLGIDFNLNGGSLTVVAGSTATISDNGFACDSIIYNASTVTRSTAGTNGWAVHQTNASSKIVVNAQNITSTLGTVTNLNAAGTMVINSLVTGGSGVVQNVVSSTGTSCTVNGNIISANTGGTTGFVITAGTGKLNGDVTVAGTHAISISGGTLTANGRIVTTTAGKDAIAISGGSLFLVNPIIIAGAGAFSINSTGARNVIIYGSGSQNLAANGTTTFLGGSMTTSVNFI